MFREFAQLIGRRIGLVDPPRPEPRMPCETGRDHALNALMDYLALVEFRRAGSRGGDSVPLTIPRDQMYTEMPDNVVDLKFPTLAVIGAEGRTDELAPLGPAIPIEETLGVYQPGTVLMNAGEHIEQIKLEVWADRLPMRRGLLAGLEVAMQPDEDRFGLFLSLPDYFDQVAVFTPIAEERIDEPSDVVVNRRRAHLTLELRVQHLYLVNANTLEPRTLVSVVDR